METPEPCEPVFSSPLSGLVQFALALQEASEVVHPHEGVWMIPAQLCLFSCNSSAVQWLRLTAWEPDGGNMEALRSHVLMPHPTCNCHSFQGSTWPPPPRLRLGQPQGVGEGPNFGGGAEPPLLNASVSERNSETKIPFHF